MCPPGDLASTIAPAHVVHGACNTPQRYKQCRVARPLVQRDTPRALAAPENHDDDNDSDNSPHPLWLHLEVWTCRLVIFWVMMEVTLTPPPRPRRGVR